MDLSPRKREVLRRVVEEYVASRQPVGSRALVERAGFAVSSSTIRSELAELEGLGLLMHPHTSAGRVPTEAGYRVYADELVAESGGGKPEAFPVDLTAMRHEVEAALQRTTETLSEATRLLALVSAPAIDTAIVRHVEVLQLRPEVVIVVVITATGEVTKRVFESPDALDPGVVEWGREYLNETVSGRRLGVSAIRRSFDDARLGPRERAFLGLVRPAFVEIAEQSGSQLYVGGAAGLLEDSSGAEREAAQRLLTLLER
ncbi:MAG: heat-inducible transcription repressor HrcA, partial [Gaiella sp.]